MASSLKNPAMPLLSSDDDRRATTTRSEDTYELKLQSRVGIVRVLVRVPQQGKLAKLGLDLNVCRTSSKSEDSVVVGIDALRHGVRHSVESQAKN